MNGIVSDAGGGFADEILKIITYEMHFLKNSKYI